MLSISLPRYDGQIFRSNHWFLTALILIAYVSLILELVVIRVPSVASSHSLVQRRTPRNTPQGNRFANWPAWKKFLLLQLPSGLVIILFCLPLLLTFLPTIREIFGLAFESGFTLTNIVASGCIILGRSISFVAMHKLWKSFTQFGQQNALVTSGFFALSRNPGLMGNYLFYFGLVLVFPHLLLIFGGCFIVLHMHQRVKIEEEFLQAKFGEPYTSYRSKVRRYV